MSFRRIIASGMIVVATLLGLPAAHSADASTTTEPQLSLETRKQMYFVKVDAEGAETADKLMAVYIYLYRGGADLTPGKWISPFEGERQKRLFNRGIMTDKKVRASVSAWIKLFGSNLTAIADPLGEVEAKVLSRDAYSLALLGSHRFSSRILEISRAEGFDFRPVIRSKIRELQFSSDAVFMIGTGGIFGWAVKALGLVKASAVLSTVSISAFAGQAIWDYATEEPFHAPTTTAITSGAQTSSLQIRHDVEVSKENERRLVVLNHARELQKASAGVSTEEFKKNQQLRLEELRSLRTNLKTYQTKLQRDELPIKFADDDKAVRADVARSLQYLFEILDQIS